MSRFTFVFLVCALISIAGALECPVVDQAGSGLVGATLEDEGFVSCIYPKAGTCTYFDGAFDSGSDKCPDELVGSVRARADGVCPLKDQAGGALVSEDTSGRYISCDYETSRCTYLKNGGGFDSGSSLCPFDVQASVRRRAGACPDEDNAGGALTKEGTIGNFIACFYETSSCTYYRDGGFDSGSSLCPESI